MSKILDELKKRGTIFIDPLPESPTEKGVKGIVNGINSVLKNKLILQVYLIKRDSISSELVDKLEPSGLKSISDQVHDLNWIRDMLRNNPDELSQKAKEYYILIK